MLSLHGVIYCCNRVDEKHFGVQLQQYATEGEVARVRVDGEVVENDSVYVSLICLT